MPGPPHPLYQAGDGAGGAVLNDMVHIAYVYPQLHGGGADQSLQLSCFEGLLRLHPGLHGEAAVVHSYRQAHLAETGAQNLRRLTGVDEDQALLALNHLFYESDLGRQAGIALQGAGQGPVPLARHGTGHQKIAAPLYIGLDYFIAPVAAHQQPGHIIRRAHRGREPYPLKIARQLGQPLQKNGQLRSALGSGHLMYLIHHHHLDPGEILAQPFSGEHHLQRLGGGYQQIRWVQGLPSPVCLAGVPVPHCHRDAEPLSPKMKAAQHVPVQGPQGGYVNSQGALALAIQDTMKYGQAGSLGLSRAGGSDEQHILTG